MRTQTTTDLREKIVKFIKTEAQGMSLNEVNQALKEVHADLEASAVIKIIDHINSAGSAFDIPAYKYQNVSKEASKKE